jgi:protein SCO1/2
MESRQKILFVTFVLTAFIGGSFFMYLALQRPGPAPAHATVLPEPMSLPEFSLVDQSGQEFNRDSFAGRWNLVFFGFTHCPDICPATLQQLALARAAIADEGNNGGQALPQIVLISVDPERDTPQAMREYISHFGTGISGVTGSIDELRKLTRATGIFFEKSAQGGENYGVDHSAVVLVIDPQAKFHALFSAPHSVDNFVSDIPLIIGSP